MPMFGASASASVAEAYVMEDGGFTVVGPMDGARHILVIGKGREALKMVSLNVVEARPNSVGTVEMRDACPK